MKMSKKILSIILSIMMVVTIIPITANAATPTLTITSSKTEVIVGEIITIDVIISENSQIGVLTVDLVYDSAVFEAVSIVSYGIFHDDDGKKNEAVNCNYSSGKSRFTGAVAGTIVDGGLLFSVKLKALKSSDSNISIDVVEVCDNDFNTISVYTNAIKIKVSTLKKGDVNGDGIITVVDARMVLQFVAGIRAFTEEEIVQADVSRDNSVSVIDARAILQIVAGLLESSNDIEITPITSTIKVPNIILSANFKYANIGDVVTVTVTLPEKSALSGITADICFDSSTYKPLEMKSGDLSAIVNYKFGNGKSRFTTAAATTFEQEGTLCTLKLEVLKTTNTNISLDVVEAIDEDYNYFSITTDDIVFCSEHQYDEWVVVIESTCCKNGFERGVCNICGAVHERIIPLAEHTYEKHTNNPTCTSTGENWESCYVCGDIINIITIPATGHHYTWYTISVATCETDGVMLGECSVCEDIDIKATPMTGHNYVNGVCVNCESNTSGGNTKPTCTIHSYTWETIVEASCTKEGVCIGTCSVCEDIAVDYHDATGHKYDTVVTAPTCSEQGYTTCTCTCGDTYVDDYIDAIGHSLANSVEENYVAPTCTENGSKDVVVYCSVCNEEINRETIAINTTGHNMVNGDCTNCDYTENTGNEDNNEVIDPSDNCDCNCHKSGISKFFFDFALFFQRIFGSNKYCDCGVAHY